MLDSTDARIINSLQGGFPVCERPYAEVARMLGIGETDLIARIARLRETGVLSRFGPMFNAERMGGAFCLCAMAVPHERFDEVVAVVNAHDEVAHNYERAHALNMWFVLASGSKARIAEVVREIENDTGLAVHLFPKLKEYFIGLRVEVAE